mgnify:FL=1
MSNNLYSDSHTIEVLGSNTLTLKASTVTITGDINFTDGTMEDLEVTGTLTCDTVTSNGTAFLLTTAAGGATVTATGDITLETSGATGDIKLVSGDIISLTAVDDITLTATDNITLTASDDITMTATDKVSITGTSSVVIFGKGAESSIQMTDVILLSTLGALANGEINMTPLTMVDITATNSTSGNTSHVLDVANDWNDAQCDGVRIRLRESDNDTNVWCRFTSGASGSQTLRGRIRGTSGSGATAFQADGTNGGGTVDSVGEVVYASGGADFGEWIEMGDLEEWNPNQDQLDYMEAHAPLLGLPEGWVCYVRNNKFHKEGPGTPMVVTKSSFVVGNEYDKEDYIGEIFSFAGQIGVIVKGDVNDGDFLIPSGDYYCTGISPDEITFKDYMKVIGTAWTGNDKDFGKVLCAIGVKNTY